MKTGHNNNRFEIHFTEYVMQTWNVVLIILLLLTFIINVTDLIATIILYKPQ